MAALIPAVKVVAEVVKVACFAVATVLAVTKLVVVWQTAVVQPVVV